MTKEMNQYSHEFASVFSGEPWYGKSIMSILELAVPANVSKKNTPASHSAYEITHHLFAWRDLLVKRLNSDTTASIEGNSAEDWAPLPIEKTAANWQALVKKLEQNQHDLAIALEKWKDSDLDKNFAGTGSTLRSHLEGQIQHDIYHAGQIALAIKNA